MEILERSVRVNRTDIHYLETGGGAPLVLLHAGLCSTSKLWSGHPSSYYHHLDKLAAHFRVIAPDARGHGRTANPGGEPIRTTQLADDVLALIQAIGLERAAICGFSDGAQIATCVAIRKPSAVSVLVNDAGYDGFNPDPQAPTYQMLRTMLGGAPDATTADYAAAERFFGAPHMRGFLDLLIADHDGARGPGSFKKLVVESFDRLTSPHEYTFADFAKITAPTLVLTGDRDICTSVEEGVVAFRKLAKGELAVLPNEGHMLTASAVQSSLEFLRRHAGKVQ